MTATEKTIAIIAETAKLYPTSNIFTILKVLQLDSASIHSLASDEWILHRAESVFKTIKKDRENGQNT